MKEQENRWSPRANLPLGTSSRLTKSDTPDSWDQRKSLIQLVCSYSSYNPIWVFSCPSSFLRHQSLTNPSAHSLPGLSEPGSHLKRCLEEFLSPPTRALPPPLTEIPHLAWKADVLPKGKETGLGGLCSGENASVLRHMLSLNSSLKGHDFWSTVVMITQSIPFSSYVPSWTPLPLKEAMGPSSGWQDTKKICQLGTLRLFSPLLNMEVEKEN